MKKLKEQHIPMYFAYLEIENVKCFGDKKQILDLRDSNGAISPWTLILGDNGVGKTTLLKCLAWMIPVQAPKSKDDNADGNSGNEQQQKEEKVRIKPYMDDFQDESEYEQLIRLGENVKTRISATFTNGVNLGQIPSKESSVSLGMNFERINGKLEVIEPNFGELQEFNTTNLYAYSASRHMAFKNFENSELKSPISNLFSDSGDLYDAEQVLSNLDYASIRDKIEGGKDEGNDDGKTAKLLLKVKQILVDLLPDIENTEWIIINPPLNKNGTKNENLVEVQTPYGKVPLYDLSLGYQTMLAWTVDLALRMLWRNPDCDNPLQEPAVVVVDEIDLHLHPKWQRMVREHLTTHFPKTQFICTAHSPFMAQSSEVENLCVINRIEGEVRIQNEPLVVEGWRIGQVATSDLFGISSERSPEVEKLVNQRRDLLANSDRSEKDEAELKRLDEILSKLPVTENEDDQRLLNQIREAAELLKKEGKLK